MALEPGVRRAAQAAVCTVAGFLGSAASLGQSPQPLAMGLITAVTGWRAVLICLGAMAGYPLFWGMAGSQGVVWSAAGGLLTLLVGNREERKDQPLMIPALAAVLTAVAGLCFRLLLHDGTPVRIFALRVVVTFFTSALFGQSARCRDPITDWLCLGLGTLALAQVELGPYGNLGYAAGAAVAVAGAFPGAALTGLGLDLAQVSPVPMTAVLCLAYFIRLIPFDKRWQHYIGPPLAYGLLLVVTGRWAIQPLPALAVGSVLGAFLPPRPQLIHRRGQTGTAQVRLELGAQVLTAAAGMVAERIPGPIDQEALLDKARQRACTTCSMRKSCLDQAQLTVQLLEYPLDAQCRKAGRLIPELRRAQDQLRWMKADRLRQQEYRRALIQQYRFLGNYLRTLADGLPRHSTAGEPSYRVEVSARSRGKEAANGDVCLAFSGTECRYFVALCDGMGTGLGAAQDSREVARLLRKMLTAGFPPEHALPSINSLLTLGSSAGAATMDLAELRLDTGSVTLYKWGAAPSWLLRRSGAEKIGTATPPPGLGIEPVTMAVRKLSLRQGEALILLSDGVDGEEALRQFSLTPDAPPGELAAKILEEGCRDREDDATAAVIRLRPVSLPTS